MTKQREPTSTPRTDFTQLRNKEGERLISPIMILRRKRLLQPRMQGQQHQHLCAGSRQPRQGMTWTQRAAKSADQMTGNFTCRLCFHDKRGAQSCENSISTESILEKAKLYIGAEAAVWLTIIIVWT